MKLLDFFKQVKITSLHLLLVDSDDVLQEEIKTRLPRILTSELDKCINLFTDCLLVGWIRMSHFSDIFHNYFVCKMITHKIMEHFEPCLLLMNVHGKSLFLFFRKNLLFSFKFAKNSNISSVVCSQMKRITFEIWCSSFSRNMFSLIAMNSDVSSHF